MIYMAEGVLAPEEVRVERGLDKEGVVEQQMTEERVNIAGGRDQDKKEEN